MLWYTTNKTFKNLKVTTVECDVRHNFWSLLYSGKLNLSNFYSKSNMLLFTTSSSITEHCKIYLIMFFLMRNIRRVNRKFSPASRVFFYFIFVFIYSNRHAKVARNTPLPVQRVCLNVPYIDYTQNLYTEGPTTGVRPCHDLSPFTTVIVIGVQPRVG